MEPVLGNGIRLPHPWPPKPAALTREPMSPPWLAAPPEVIPVDGGRQLFVDDFLVETTTLSRAWHLAEYHTANPVLRPDRPWETGPQSQGHPAPTAMPFSDGVWYDSAAGQFRMWYMGGYCAATCLATSRDGLAWGKPELDVKPGTNIVLEGVRDSATVWPDPDDPDPARRYKLFVYARAGLGWEFRVHVSADGIHWSAPVARTPPIGDRSTVFRNPFRNVWVYSARCDAPGLGRARLYRECTDVLAGAAWQPGEAVPWVGADRLDPPRPGLGAPQLYNLDAVAYESVLLGLFTIWPGQPQDRAKPNYVALGYSRDGFHWSRPDRRPFLPVSERYGDWNWGNVQSAGGGCLVVGDRLFFYVSGRAGVQGSPASGVSSTGLATLRRDGFASMDAGAAEGELTTRPVRFGGRHLFVNLDAPAGELTVEVLDRAGAVLAPFTRAACRPLNGDGTRLRVTWEGAADLAAVAGQPVRFRFHLRAGRLYAFWVSPEASGASHGYVAAGGPGLTGLTDTTGR